MMLGLCCGLPFKGLGQKAGRIGTLTTLVNEAGGSITVQLYGFTTYSPCVVSAKHRNLRTNGVRYRPC